MPQIIEVPGFGQVEFPDGMDDNQITAAIQKNMGLPTPTPTAPSEPALTPFEERLGIASPTALGVYGAGKEVGKALISPLQQAGETIGKAAAYPFQSKEALAYDPTLTPTKGELVGAPLQIASVALPYGRIAKGAGALAGKVLPSALAKVAGQATAGAAGGYAYEAGEKLQKGEAPIPGLSTALGAAIPSAITGGAMTKAAIQERVPSRIINSLITPLPKAFSYGKNPGRVIAEEKLTANSWDDLVSKISDKRTEIGENLGAISETFDKQAQVKKITLDISKAITPLDSAMQRAAAQNNKTLLNRLSEAKEAITKKLTLGMDEEGNQVIQAVGKNNLSSMTFKEAVAIKKHIGDLTKWTGNESDDKMLNATLKQVWGGIKGKLNNEAERINPSVAASFRKLNEKYADITSAEIAAKYREKLIQRQPSVSLKGHIGAMGAAVITLLHTGGSAIPAIAAGLGGAVLDKALSSPAVKTRVAAWLAKSSPEQKSIIYRKLPQLEVAIKKAFGEGTRFPGDIIADGLLKRKPSIIRGGLYSK